MSDFGDMLREALSADADYDQDAGSEALERALRGFERRLRTVRVLGALLVTGPLVFLLGGLWALSSPGLGSDHRVLGTLLVLFGLSASGAAKIWFHGMLAHVGLQRELKLTQLAVARLSEDLERRGQA